MRLQHTRTKFAELAADETVSRQGAFLVLSAFCLTGCLVFVSLAVDIGFLNLTKQGMQNSVDAAALAAAQEITAAVNNAPPDVEDVTLYAREQARQVAKHVAELNGVFVDPQRDVRFGRRYFDEITQSFEIEWDVSPSNVVKVTARRDQEDHTQPDGKLRLFFAGITGDRFARVVADAIAYVESRDIVVVHDFSRSMNFDSYFNTESTEKLTQPQIEHNLSLVYSDLNPADGPIMVFWPRYLEVTDTDEDVTGMVRFRYTDIDATANTDMTEVKLRFTDGSEQTFAPGSQSSTHHGTGGNYGKDVASVWITCEIEVESEEVDQDPVTLTGKKPKKKSQPQIYVTFSGDRKSVTTTSSKDLSNVVLEFCDGTHYKFDGLSGKTRTFSGVGSNSGKLIKTVWVKSGNNKSGDGPGYGERFNNPTGTDDCGGGGGTSTEEVTLEFHDTNANVKTMFGLNTIPYPYPAGSWENVINHSRYDSGLYQAGFREMYGGLTFTNYILKHESGSWETPDLWKTRHYPFHAIKEGHLLFADFLNGLGFDDRIGMVSYDTYHRWETSLNHPDPTAPTIDISSDPITDDYEAIKNIMRYKQASQYAYATNMGGGLEDAIEMTLAHSRAGARRTILLMTDGNTNTIDSGANTSLPSGWDWDELFDYDGDGERDYYTSSYQRRYIMRVASEAVANGITVHTMSVGIDADRDLMKAIAHYANGHHIDVPGGFSVADMEHDVKEAFHRIASFVPPAKLLNQE